MRFSRENSRKELKVDKLTIIIISTISNIIIINGNKHSSVSLSLALAITVAECSVIQ